LTSGGTITTPSVTSGQSASRRRAQGLCVSYDPSRGVEPYRMRYGRTPPVAVSLPDADSSQGAAFVSRPRRSPDSPPGRPDAVRIEDFFRLGRGLSRDQVPERTIPPLAARETARIARVRKNGAQETAGIRRASKPLVGLSAGRRHPEVTAPAGGAR
jgi:hypothetical protein